MPEKETKPKDYIKTKKIDLTVYASPRFPFPSPFAIEGIIFELNRKPIQTDKTN